jgi:hypothetical protein
MPDPRQDQRAVAHQLLRERRTQLRFPALLLASCRLGAARTGLQWAASVRNLSTKGISLALPRPFSPGCFLTVKLHREQGRVLLTTQVRVVFVRNDAGSWLHGCQFCQRLNERELERLL